MQTEILHQIVEAIILDEFILNWRFYVLLGGLTFLTTVIGNSLSSYMKKRGETLATKADMDEILRQVSETTRATEEVRSAVSKADWVEREWRKTRRVKLEELLSSAYSLDQWLETQRNKWLHSEKVAADQAPMERMKLLAVLYFPELTAETDALWFAHHNALMFVVENANDFLQARYAKDVAGYQDASEQFRQGWQPLYESTRSCLHALEKKASELMMEVISA